MWFDSGSSGNLKIIPILAGLMVALTSLFHANSNKTNNIQSDHQQPLPDIKVCEVLFYPLVRLSQLTMRFVHIPIRIWICGIWDGLCDNQCVLYDWLVCHKILNCLKIYNNNLKILIICFVFDRIERSDRKHKIYCLFWCVATQKMCCVQPKHTKKLTNNPKLIHWRVVCILQCIIWQACHGAVYTWAWTICRSTMTSFQSCKSSTSTSNVFYFGKWHHIPFSQNLLMWYNQWSGGMTIVL